MAPNIPAAASAAERCPRFATIDPHPATGGAAASRYRLVQWRPSPRTRERNVEQKLNVTTRQVLSDLAFTALAAFGTGATVGGVAFLVVKWFA